jgi:hypothetical protein
MEKLKFVIEQVFHKKSDFGTDPIGYKVKLDNKIVSTFGDDYHERGYERSESWIHGYCKAKSVDFDIEYIEVVDKKFWG